MPTTLHWKGDEIKRKMERAARAGIDETTAACINVAKSNHPWIYRLGTAERSIQMRAAESRGGRTVGRWGSFATNYFRRLELGFRGTDSAGRSYSQAPMPTLRPAADKEYKHLARRIKEAFRRA
jgi:hypothetical protein